MMMEWAEVYEENGAIIALDQEKAYDKVDHTYLWKVLERFGIPPDFIHLVQSLYKHANTSIMINGILSRPYRIYRGVRQGDPLSCLLFDLAIEPLSAMIRASEIKGFNIPRYREALKAVLFADDTTVYLSNEDDFATLQGILDTWCSAAKARFNISKTEIIPLGAPDFRRTMADTYRTTGSWENYPRGVHVAQEGEAVRILGAFFGNGVDQVDIWSLVLTKIVAMRKPLMHAIARWRNGHATLQGKKYVIQMIIGGMTQFFTTVQRMPNSVLMRLNAILRDYLWDDRRTPPVAMKHVYLPVELGGLGVLDLSVRSEAIDIMWLKSYLDFTDDRPIWAFVADDLLAGCVPKDCPMKTRELRVNPFLQNWKPKARGLPHELTSMIAVAKKYELRMEGLAFSKKIQEARPMWGHAHANRLRLSRLSTPSKLIACMRAVHAVATVGDFIQLADVLNDAEHRPSARCNCEGCAPLRDDTRCANPHLCATRAKDILDTLPGKWDPRTRQPEDYERKAKDALRREGIETDLIPFDRCITTYGDLGQVFRIFTGPEPVSDECPDMELEENGSELTIATDGSCIRNGEVTAQVGAGIFLGPGNPHNQSIRLPHWMEQSNQTGEMVATLVATRSGTSRMRLKQITDSKTTLDSVSKWRQRHEDTGYILQKNSGLTRQLIAELRARKAHTLFSWVKGHSGHPGNEAADRLAAAGTEKAISSLARFDINPRFRVTGAKLQAMTQKLAYRAIRARKDESTEPRPRTAANMDRITSGIKAAYGLHLHDAAIWKSLRSKHISRNASQFLWRAVHDAYMIGTHWLRPNMSVDMQERAYCAHCAECETMSHIIFECSAKGQGTLWKLLEDTWSLTNAKWHEPTWGTTFGAACARFETEKGRRITALESLWCILCSETLHLVWKLRCERVIQNDGQDFCEDEIRNRYYSALESRLCLDRRTAAIAKGKKGLKPQDVERIWMPILVDGDNLPPKWVVDSGVLVGIKRGR